MAQKSKGRGKKKQFQSKPSSKSSIPDTPPHTDTPCLFSLSFGSRNAYIATIKNNSLEIVVNENGDRLTPSFVTYEPKSGRQGQLRAVIGQVASQSADRCDPNCFGHLLEFDELMQNTSKVNKLENSKDFKIVTELGTSTLSHGNILVDFLSAIRDTVSAYCNTTATHCIIAHSSMVSMEILETLRNACLKSGLIPLQILPSSAFPLLAYGIGQDETDFEINKTVLVMDIGHNYAEVAILRVSHGLFRTIKISRYEDLGGQEFTRLLSEHVITTFNSKYKCDVTSSKAVLKITREASNAKHILSTLPSASVDIDSLFNDLDCHLEVTRGRFEASIAPLISRLLGLTFEMLSQVEMESSCVTNVVCVGGSCRIPMIQSQLQVKFPTATIHATLPPDEVVALGAARQCQILEQNNSIQDFVESNHTDIMSCLKHELVLKIDSKQIVFKSGTPLPATKSATLEVSGNKLTFSVCENIKQIGTEIISIPDGVKKVSLRAEAIQSLGLQVSLNDVTSGRVIDTFLIAFNSSD